MLQVNVKLDLNEKLFLKNPQETDLGRRIIEHSVLLFDELGFEAFTFRKLAKRMKSTEASVYRYFENKHYLFVYLVNWYWEWMSFRISFFTINLDDPKDKLRAALKAIVDISKRNTPADYMDTEVLHRIVVTEGAKAYHQKNVDEENKYGFFLAYKKLCKKLADILLEVKPGYAYPKALSSMLLETANNNLYFAEHLPRLTDIKHAKGHKQEILQLLWGFTMGCLSADFPQFEGQE